MEQVAVIGLGAMGLPIAQRLAETLPVVVFDVMPDRVAAAAGAGARVAPTAADAGRASGVVLIAVRTLAQARDALFGPAGAATTLRPGTVVALSSTVGADGARELAAELGEHDAELLDMPVSGGPARARRGDLLVMVGGSDRAVAAARPVIDMLASTTARVGTRPGDGQAMKTVNQLLCGVHIAVAAEALAFAEAMQLDATATWEVLRAGAAASFMLDDRGDRMVHGTDQVNSALDIFVKDMGLVLDAARENSYPAPLASAAEQLYLAGRRAGLGRRDDSSVIEVLRGPSPGSG